MIHDPFLDQPEYRPDDDEDLGGCMGIFVAAFLMVVVAAVLFVAATYGFAGHGG